MKVIKLKLNYQELNNMKSALAQVSHVPGRTLAHIMMKNRKNLKKYIKKFLSGLETLPKKFQEQATDYEKRIKALCEKMCERNDDGSVKTTPDGQYVFPDVEAIRKADEDLKAQYPELNEAQEELKKKHEEYLQEPQHFNFYGINFEDVPLEITIDQLEGIDGLVIYKEEAEAVE